MLKPGKMKEISDEMINYKIDIIGLQEIRWQGQGRIDKKEYTLLYSGPENRTGRFGTGFMISSRIRKSLLSFESINEKICKLRIKGRFRNMTFITVHAPTEDKTEQEKEDFYEELENVFNLCQEYDMVTILGDFNAKIGREDEMRGTVGKYSMHENSNENGNLLIEFSVRNNLIIKSTCFPHKQIHLGTWKVPGSDIVNQIDHVLTKKRHSSSIIDVKTCRGPNCDSDHYLVKAIIAQKLSKVEEQRKSTRKHWDLEKLKRKDVNDEYQRSIENRLTSIEEDGDIDEYWNELEVVIKEVAEEKVGEKKRERNSSWFDEECMDAIRKKNEARNRMLARDTRSTRKEYKRLRKAANKVCRKKKTEAIQKQIKEIDELNDQPNEVRKFYRAVKNMTQGYTAQMGMYKNKDGEILADEDQISERWTEHFSELLNSEVDEDHEELDLQDQLGEELNIEIIEEPTLEEVEMVINKLRNNRSPGEDEIVAELIKKGGNRLIKSIHKLIKDIWEQERMPVKWMVGIICPIYKKGDKTLCDSYRGITLLSVAYKVLSGVVQRRVSLKAEEIITEYQGGFRPNRGTTDQIFTLRQIMEKHFEHDHDLHLLFVDFKQAFDSVKRSALYKALNELGLPRKLIRLIRMTMLETSAKVKVGNKIGRSFLFNNGVKQGDGLSATLFILALHWVVKEIDPGGTIFYKCSQILAYADDVAIVARSVRKLKETFTLLKENAEKIGLKINCGKTKYMCMSTSEPRRRPQALEIDDDRFEGVSTFKYLGALMASDNSQKPCLKDRIAAGNRAYFANNKLLKSRLVKRSAKRKIYNTLIRPVVTYGCECWTLSTSEVHALRRFERRILRKIFGPIHENGVFRIRRNEELDDLIDGQDIVRFSKSQRLRWLGHLTRMPDERVAKRVWEGRFYNQRRRGRPRLRWQDGVEADLAAMRVRGWRRKALIREDWRLIVAEAKADRRL